MRFRATMGCMPASDVAPLPRLGEVFFDVRGNSRTMRLSWYADTGVAVFSIWQGGTCTGTFRVPIADLPRLVDALQRGPCGRSARGADVRGNRSQADPRPRRRDGGAAPGPPGDPLAAGPPRPGTRRRTVCRCRASTATWPATAPQTGGPSTRIRPHTGVTRILRPEVVTPSPRPTAATRARGNPLGTGPAEPGGYGGYPDPAESSGAGRSRRLQRVPRTGTTRATGRPLRPIPPRRAATPTRTTTAGNPSLLPTAAIPIPRRSAATPTPTPRLRQAARPLTGDPAGRGGSTRRRGSTTASLPSRGPGYPQTGDYSRPAEAGGRGGPETASYGGYPDAGEHGGQAGAQAHGAYPETGYPTDPSAVQPARRGRWRWIPRQLPAARTIRRLPRHG